MPRTFTDIEGDDAVYGAAGFAASILLGIALRPVRTSIGLENVAILYVAIVAVTAAAGGRLAGLIAAVSAALSYDFFFTTPYETLRIDSWAQVLTVLLLLGAGLLAALGGRSSRRATIEAREEAAAIRLLQAVSRAAAGADVDRIAAEGLRDLLQARTVQVVRIQDLRRGSNGAAHVVTTAGAPTPGLDLDSLVTLDDEGRIPAGHRRAVGGTFVLPAQGVVLHLTRRHRRVGSLVILPEPDHPLLRTTRIAIAAAAHVLAAAGQPAASGGREP